VAEKRRNCEKMARSTPKDVTLAVTQDPGDFPEVQE
jgi:hypothetical protein